MTRAGIVLLGTGIFTLASAAPARADIPAGYKGLPFDPAVAGGPTVVPPTVKKGPYAIPGRVDLVNYDMGGSGVGYNSASHYTTKDGDGYRIDRPAATMCLTLPTKPDLWYDTSAALDGKAYPAEGAKDFYIGSIHDGDWFNYTVDVKTAGTYTVSSTFSTGNGPPGGEGGDGSMSITFFANNVMLTQWKAVFPDYQNKANFHLWKAYPNFAMVTLAAGLQVIKIQLGDKHLNLDYLQFDLAGGGTGAAGTGGGAAGTGGAAGAGGGAGIGGVAGTNGAAGSTGAAGSSGEAGTNGAAGATAGAGTGGTISGAAGSTGAAGSGYAGVSGAGGIGGAAGASGVAGTGVPGAKDSSGGCACSLGRDGTPDGAALTAGAALFALGLVARGRRRQRRR